MQYWYRKKQFSHLFKSSALHIACCSGNLIAAKILIEKFGANTSQRNKLSKTPYLCSKNEEISEVMGKVLAFVTLVNSQMKINIVKEDPDDDKIIECAIESHSKYIITYDKHLLNFKEHLGIRIIRPEEARAII